MAKKRELLKEINMDLSVLAFLLFFIIFREITHAYQTQKLVNKLMSRNFYDYKITKQVTKGKKGSNITPIAYDENLYNFENDIINSAR